MNEMSIHVNGESRRTAADNLDRLLDELGFETPRQGIAVALNGCIVPRGAWSEQSLDEGDRVEVVGAVQGG
jgi:sulfur carrier protein